MSLKDSLIGEIRFSCSNVTDVATISVLVVSNASVIRTYIQHGYTLADVIRPVGLPVAKDALIRRSRFDEGIDHRTFGTPFSYNKASPEIAEVGFSRRVLKRPCPACPPNQAPTLGIVEGDI